jgi:hypothetical protein
LREKLEEIRKEVKECLLNGDFVVDAILPEFFVLTIQNTPIRISLNHYGKSLNRGIVTDDTLVDHFNRDEENKIYENILKGGLTQAINEKEIRISQLNRELDILKSKL